MQWFQTPEGEAGSDRIDAMVESIQAAIEQMFWQVAKRDSLTFGVGRTAKMPFDPDPRMQLDAQKRECDGLVVFHAGKALETALQVIYAKTNNRIRGREYPGVSDGQMKKDRKTHKLRDLYKDILESIEANPGLQKEVKEEFESVYQTAFHRGISDLIVDNELAYQSFHPEDAPFREVKMGGLHHGAEITLDYSGIGQILGAEDDNSNFSRLPCHNFPEFLAKADVAYYGDRNMRWAHYSARDHESGRLYIVIGSRFFARLVRGLVRMADEQWMWDERFARKWCERRQEIVRTSVDANIRQSFAKAPELSDPKSVDEMMEYFRSYRSTRTDNYDSLHIKVRIERACQATESYSNANNDTPSEQV